MKNTKFNLGFSLIILKKINVIIKSYLAVL